MKDGLDDILADLKRTHREVSAPPDIESRLRSATRARRRWRMQRWTLAAAALLIVAIATWRMKPQPNAQLTGFVIVPGSEALPPPAATIIVRMELTRGELSRYVPDVPPAATTKRVQADFIVGDDGLARAIRFVR